MKEIILSADGDCMLYSVPDEVADNLDKYCLEFCNEWLKTSPDATKYRKDNCLCYNESDFIDYLNDYVFPDKKSVFVKNIGWINFARNEEYKHIPHFNF